MSIIVKLLSVGSQKADRRLIDDADPDHVAVDKTVNQLNSEQYWHTLPSILTTIDCPRSTLSDEHQRNFLDVCLRVP
jgi:hypothetical protein